MDKKTALKILIEDSFLFSPILKERLVQNIDSMTDDDISALGKMLAGDKKETLIIKFTCWRLDTSLKYGQQS